MLPSQKDLLDSLRKVHDPEIGINIVDLGLIYRIDITFKKIEIDFTLTSQGCPLADLIEENIRQIIQEDFGISNVQLQLVWEPAWNLEFMSPEARLELGYPI